MDNNNTVQQNVFDKIFEAETLLLKCEQLTSPSGKQRLKRKIQAEIRFLKSLSKNPERIKEEHLRCTNLVHLAAVLECSMSLDGVVDVLKPFAFPEAQDHLRCPEKIVVDIVADYGHSWVKVAARNPQALLVSSLGDGEYGRRTIMDQIQDMVRCAEHHPNLYQTPAIKMWFTLPVNEELKLMIEEGGAVIISDILESSRQLNDPSRDLATEKQSVNSEKGCFLFTGIKSLSLEKVPSDVILNLDVSTMIAYVSSLTNGSCNLRFQENILTEQAESERCSPVKPVLDALFGTRKLVCCETAYKDFVTITDIMAGKKEKRLTDELLSKVEVIPDQPSSRALALDVRGKIRKRPLIIFGTGDNIKAVTVTANSGFLRAAVAQGVNFVAVVHGSRALTEQKEGTAVSI